MTRTSIRTLALIYVVAGFFGWGATEIWGLVLSPWFTLAAFVLVSLFLLWRGRDVRKMKDRKSNSITPIGAAQVLAMAKTAALFAAILGGLGFGAALAFWPLLASPVGREGVISGVLVGGVSVVTAVIALIVERWCEIPPDDDENGPDRAAAGA